MHEKDYVATTAWQRLRSKGGRPGQPERVLSHDFLAWQRKHQGSLRGWHVRPEAKVAQEASEHVMK